MDKSPDFLLEIQNLKTHFQMRNGVVPAVDNVDVSVATGETVGMVGESGCGKSITWLSVLRLVAPPGRIVAGKILFGGRNLLDCTIGQMHAVRGKDIAMIFQEPMTSLNPVYSVGKQVSEAILIHDQAMGKKQARKKTVEMFRLVGIPEPESRLGAYPHQLSGGMRQRVMIAMALICRPKLLIADEPTTALDVTIEAQILKLMKKLQEEIHTSIVLISHNLGVIAETCDRVYVMYAGRIMEQAGVFELFDRPLHPYTGGLLRSIPRKNHKGEEGKKLYSIRGNVPNMLMLPKGCKFYPRCEQVLDICREQEPGLIDAGAGHGVRCWKYGG